MLPEIFIKEELSLNNNIQQQYLGSGALPGLLQEKSCKNQLSHVKQKRLWDVTSALMMLQLTKTPVKEL